MSPPQRGPPQSITLSKVCVALFISLSQLRDYFLTEQFIIILFPVLVSFLSPSLEYKAHRVCPIDSFYFLHSINICLTNEGIYSFNLVLTAFLNLRSHMTLLRYSSS